MRQMVQHPDADRSRSREPRCRCSSAPARPGGPGALGQFQMTTSLVRTDGGQTDATILMSVLGQDRARFAVFPHGKHKYVLSLGLFLSIPQLD